MLSLLNGKAVLYSTTETKYCWNWCYIKSINLKSYNLATFSTTIVRGHTKLKGHGLKLNLIAEPSENNQLPPSVQCTPTYCNLEPGSKRVTVGLRNVLVKQITIPYRAVVCQYSWPTWYPKFRPQKDRTHQNKGGKDNFWILDQLDLGELNTWSVD